MAKLIIQIAALLVAITLAVDAAVVVVVNGRKRCEYYCVHYNNNIMAGDCDKNAFFTYVIIQLFLWKACQITAKLRWMWISMTIPTRLTL